MHRSLKLARQHVAEVQCGAHYCPPHSQSPVHSLPLNPSHRWKQNQWGAPALARILRTTAAASFTVSHLSPMTWFVPDFYNRTRMLYISCYWLQFIMMIIVKLFFITINCHLLCAKQWHKSHQDTATAIGRNLPKIKHMMNNSFSFLLHWRRYLYTGQRLMKMSSSPNILYLHSSVCITLMCPCLFLPSLSLPAPSCPKAEMPLAFSCIRMVFKCFMFSQSTNFKILGKVFNWLKCWLP